MEDDRGVEREGREAVAELVEQWRYAGSLIPQIADLPRNGHLALGRYARPPARRRTA